MKSSQWCAKLLQDLYFVKYESDLNKEPCGTPFSLNYSHNCLLNIYFVILLRLL